MLHLCDAVWCRHSLHAVDGASDSFLLQYRGLVRGGSSVKVHVQFSLAGFYELGQCVSQLSELKDLGVQQL